MIAYLESVAVAEGLAAHFARHGNAGRVELLDVQSKVSFPAASGWAQFALEDGLVPRVDHAVGLQRVGLGEPGVANITLVRLLSRVNPHVSLQLEGVGGSVGAVRTLVRPLASVTPDVSLELGQLHAGVVALGAFVRSLKSMTVPIDS